MSWEVSLVSDETSRSLEVEHHNEGSITPVGGTTRTSMSVTSNYGVVFRLGIPGYKGFISTFHEMKAKKSVSLLTIAVHTLGTKKWKPDYFAPTPGNAGHVLNIMLSWAKKHPNGIWKIV